MTQQNCPDCYFRLVVSFVLRYPHDFVKQLPIREQHSYRMKEKKCYMPMPMADFVYAFQKIYLNMANLINHIKDVGNLLSCPIYEICKYLTTSLLRLGCNQHKFEKH